MLRIYTVRLISLLLLLLAVLPRCAKVAAPAGGDKDTLPPVLIRSEPPNYTKYFSSEEIELRFNEFVQLKDVSSKLIISPPMDRKPDVRLKGKSIMIKLEEKLMDSTTYTFNFSDAIVDNNESNPLNNFEYVFSTGGSVDSLQVSGKLLDARSMKPVEGVYVMMYDQLSDSVPIREIPLFLGKTDKEGKFRISHLRSDTFKVFAIKDMNANYLFDQPSEPIAFLSEPLLVKPPAVSDSLVSDSLPGLQPDAAVLNLYLFEEEAEKKQYLSKAERPRKDQVSLFFNRPQENEPEIHPLPEGVDTAWYILEKNRTYDSLNYWITDSSLVNRENLQLALVYLAEDSTGQLQALNDTINLRFVEAAKPRRSRTETTETKEKLLISSGIRNNGVVELNQGIRLSTNTPLVHIDTSGIQLHRLIDSVWTEESFLFVRDSFKLGQCLLRYEWEEDTKYRLLVLPNTFTDFNNRTNDSLLVDFSSRKADHYGKIILNLTFIEQPVLVQFMTEKMELIRQDLVTEDRTLEYAFLQPKKYNFRAVYDQNLNRKWDTGKYLEGRQPEMIQYMAEPVEVRSNWEKELEWSVKF